jgi:hypothetical protein
MKVEADVVEIPLSQSATSVLEVDLGGHLTEPTRIID